MFGKNKILLILLQTFKNLVNKIDIRFQNTLHTYWRHLKIQYMHMLMRPGIRSFSKHSDMQKIDEIITGGERK